MRFFYAYGSVRRAHTHIISSFFMLLLVMGCMASLRGQAITGGFIASFIHQNADSDQHGPSYVNCSALEIGVRVETFTTPTNGGDYQICLNIPTSANLDQFLVVDEPGDFAFVEFLPFGNSSFCATITLPATDFTGPLVDEILTLTATPIAPDLADANPFISSGSVEVTIEELAGTQGVQTANPTDDIPFLLQESPYLAGNAFLDNLFGGTTPNEFSDPANGDIGKRILYDGTIRVRRDYTFGGTITSINPDEGSKLTLVDGSQIIVESNTTLIIEGATLSSCRGMWNGITVENNATLIIRSFIAPDGTELVPVIRDAINAVTVRNGGNLIVENAIFANNRNGILVEESASGNIDQNPTVVVRGATFEQSTLATTDQLSRLKPPFVDDEVLAGAIFHDVQDGILFSVLEPNDFNHFRNMNNGIIFHRSFANVRASIFEDMIDDGTLLSSNGVVVDDTDGTLPSLAPTQTVIGSYDPNKQVTFDNMHTAVRLINNSNTRLIETNIDNVDHGVFGDFVGHLRMTGNHVTSNISGVDINARFPDINQRIRDNVFVAKNGSGQVDEMSAFGIRLMDVDVGDGNYDQMVIRNNDFILDGATEGVYAFNSQGLRIEDQNSFTWAENTFISDAIHFEGGSRGLIYNNLIQGPDPSGFTDSRGIYVSGMPIARVACNTIDLVEKNVQFFGKNPGVLFAGNLLEGGGIGLKLGLDGAGDSDETEISEQVHYANQWNNSGFVLGAQHESSIPIILDRSLFRVDTENGNDPEYLPTVPLDNIGWFEIQTVPSSVEFTCPVGPPSPIPNDRTNDNFVTDVIADTYSTTGIWGSSYWTADYEVYKMYRLGLIDSTAHPDFSNWMIDINNSDVPAYYAVEEGMTELFRLDSIDQADYDLSIQRIRDFSDSLSSSQEALYYATTAADSLVLLNQLDSLTRELETEYDYAFFAGLDSTVAARVPGLEALNNALTTDSLFKTNRQSVNTHTFTYLTSGKLGLSQSAINDLKVIADQCPLNGGQAVYAARSLVNIVEGPSYFNDSLACAIVPENLPVKEPQKGSALVYPNPTDGLVVLRLEEGYITSIRLVDGFGRVILSKSWSNDGNVKREIDLSRLPSGMYSLEITGSDVVISTERIILQ
ncbi:hypothetical protein CEQ90_15695 [Lewinellaceae bacterium SD302]|nr:hypothetical protein CEQ90_15695 [Lewinellaceae bacterium SD302]